MKWSKAEKGRTMCLQPLIENVSKLRPIEAKKLKKLVNAGHSQRLVSWHWQNRLGFEQKSAWVCGSRCTTWWSHVWAVQRLFLMNKGSTLWFVFYRGNCSFRWLPRVLQMVIVRFPLFESVWDIQLNVLHRSNWHYLINLIRMATVV